MVRANLGRVIWTWTWVHSCHWFECFVLPGAGYGSTPRFGSTPMKDSTYLIPAEGKEIGSYFYISCGVLDNAWSLLDCILFQWVLGEILHLIQCLCSWMFILVQKFTTSVPSLCLIGRASIIHGKEGADLVLMIMCSLYYA